MMDDDFDFDMGDVHELNFNDDVIVYCDCLVPGVDEADADGRCTECGGVVWE